MFAPLLIAAAIAQPCTGGQCPPVVEKPHPAVVRVVNDLGRERSLGSGTLVAADAEQGLIVSCAHLFSDGVGKVSVVFPDQKSFAARVLEVNRHCDLSLLRIAAPSVPAAQVAEQVPRVGDPLASAGYGPHGQYATHRGRALGYVSLDGKSHNVLEMTGSARQGDSGGPIWNAQGQLAGVIFGTDGRTVDGAHCRSVREMLERFAKPQAADRGQPREETPVHTPPAKTPQPPTDATPACGLAAAFLTTRLTALLVGFGVPSALAAVLVWFFMRRAKRRLRAIVIRDQAPPPPQVIERERQFVEVQVPTDRLGALEWAMDEYVKRNPGARPTVETIEAYAKQFQSATKH